MIVPAPGEQTITPGPVAQTTTLDTHSEGTLSMPVSALNGTFDLPGWVGAQFTAGSYQTCNAALAAIFRSGPVPLVVDIETFGLGLDALRIKCVILSTDRHAVVLDPRDAGHRALIIQALQYASTLIFHKANFDIPSLWFNGMFSPHLVDKVVDTLVLARLATPGDSTGKKLDDLVKRYLGLVNKPITDLFKSLGYKTKQAGYEGLDIDAPAYLMGAASDGIGTARVWPHVHAAAVERQCTGHPFTHGADRAEAEQIVAEAHEANRWGLERTLDGLAVDVDYLDRFRAHNGAQRAVHAATLAAEGIDPGNGGQLMSRLEALGAVPADHRRTPVKIHPTTGKQTGGRLGAAEKDLEAIPHPLVTAYAAVAKMDKLDGYLAKCVNLMDANGRCHPVTDVFQAAHGRDAMADPPLHQFPELARPIILADPGRTFTSCDWSQQEPRIAMNIAGDHGPLQAYEVFGKKIYEPIALRADTSMAQAKIVVLAGLYGQGLKLLSNQLGLPWGDFLPEKTINGKVFKARYTYDAAKEIQQAVFSAIPETAEFMRRGKRTAREVQLAWTVGGRVVPIPSGTYDGQWSVQTHKWINYCVSGSAADELHRVVVLARRAGLGMGVKFGMHDELVVDTEIAHDIRKLMETPSERFCRLSNRVPVIRTDMELLGKTWVKC